MAGMIRRQDSSPLLDLSSPVVSMNTYKNISGLLNEFGIWYDRELHNRINSLNSKIINELKQINTSRPGEEILISELVELWCNTNNFYIAMLWILSDIDFFYFVFIKHGMRPDDFLTFFKTLETSVLSLEEPKYSYVGGEGKGKVAILCGVVAAVGFLTTFQTGVETVAQSAAIGLGAYDSIKNELGRVGVAAEYLGLFNVTELMNEPIQNLDGVIDKMELAATKFNETYTVVQGMWQPCLDGDAFACATELAAGFGSSAIGSLAAINSMKIYPCTESSGLCAMTPNGAYSFELSGTTQHSTLGYYLKGLDEAKNPTLAEFNHRMDELIKLENQASEGLVQVAKDFINQGLKMVGFDNKPLKDEKLKKTKLNQIAIAIKTIKEKDPVLSKIVDLYLRQLALGFNDAVTSQSRDLFIQAVLAKKQVGSELLDTLVKAPEKLKEAALAEINAAKAAKGAMEKVAEAWGHLIKGNPWGGLRALGLGLANEAFNEAGKGGGYKRHKRRTINKRRKSNKRRKTNKRRKNYKK